MTGRLGRREAGLQRLHEIDDLSAAVRRDVRRDVLSVDLALDRLHDALANGVLVFLRREIVGRRLFDELLGQRELRRLDVAVGNRDLGRGPNLVGVVELLHDENAVERPEENQVLLAAGRILSERGASGILERRGEQTICAVASLVGPQVVDLIEILAIHFRQRDELHDVDHAGRFFLQRFYLLGAQHHVLILRELVALDGVVARHHLIVLRTGVLLFQSRAALFVQHVERHARLRFRRRVEIDGNRNETERDRGGAD
jgi:hypothetical protein